MHPSTIIGQLALNYGVSERCLWSDWERRGTWIPELLGLEKYAGFVDVAESKLNTVQKFAWRISLKSDNPNASVGALKVVLKSLKIQSRLNVSKDILARLKCIEEELAKRTGER